ncbi:MAG: hypothetical protein H6Q72_19 [Firmicutes bacterium]|nr:hypothetical protein [Bacillota bacterium]
MPNDASTTGSSSLLNSVTRLLESSLTANTGLDNIITVLSLLCLFSILSRNTAAKDPVQVQPAASTNPLHKLLGDLSKSSDGGGGGFSPDTLMALLPLLNNPQLKSKLNPNAIGTVMGLINNLGGGNPSPEKPKPETKTDHSVEDVNQPTEPPPTPPSPNVVQQNQTSNSPSVHANEPMDEDTENKNYGRYLNWKNNF